MENVKKFGLNRTGIAMSPIDSKSMIDGAEKLTISPPGTDQEVAENRVRYLEEAEPLGSVPLPATVRGAMAAGVKWVQGVDAKTLIDKLGERLAFERTGVRLYDALLSKKQTAEFDDIIYLETLFRFRNEELQHFQMLEKTIRELGADPTAQTPSADLASIASMGLAKIIVDSRTSFVETLEAILMVELLDNSGWDLLVQLTESAKMPELAQRFRDAMLQEEEHLVTVRGWVQHLTLHPAAIHDVEEPEPQATGAE